MLYVSATWFCIKKELEIMQRTKKRYGYNKVWSKLKRQKKVMKEMLDVDFIKVVAKAGAVR